MELTIILGVGNSNEIILDVYHEGGRTMKLTDELKKKLGGQRLNRK